MFGSPEDEQNDLTEKIVEFFGCRQKNLLTDEEPLPYVSREIPQEITEIAMVPFETIQTDTMLEPLPGMAGAYDTGPFPFPYIAFDDDFEDDAEEEDSDEDEDFDDLDEDEDFDDDFDSDFDDDDDEDDFDDDDEEDDFGEEDEEDDFDYEEDIDYDDFEE